MIWQLSSPSEAAKIQHQWPRVAGHINLSRTFQDSCTKELAALAKHRVLFGSGSCRFSGHFTHRAGRAQCQRGVVSLGDWAAGELWNGWRYPRSTAAFGTCQVVATGVFVGTQLRRSHLLAKPRPGSEDCIGDLRARQAVWATSTVEISAPA